MSKYLEFKQIPYKGKTKVRFEVFVKRSIGICKICLGKGWIETNKGYKWIDACEKCGGSGRTDIILGRIYWFSKWRQYVFSPFFDTVWNRDCLKDIQDFLQELMDERKRAKDII